MTSATPYVGTGQPLRIREAQPRAARYQAVNRLPPWGWTTIIIGVIQLGAGFSLMAGGGFGLVIGIIVASLVTLESLLSVGGSHPWWVARHLRALPVDPARIGRLRHGEDATTLAA